MQEISFRNDILPLKDKLFRLALRITFDRAEAEDVVQETLIRVWNKRDEWTQFGSIEAYCLTVAKNLAIDRSERKDAQTVELTPEMDRASGASNPYDHLVDKEQMTLIHRLVNELPDKQRLIMQLRDIEGKSYKRNRGRPAFNRGTGKSKPLQGKAKSETTVFRYRWLWTVNI